MRYEVQMLFVTHTRLLPLAALFYRAPSGATPSLTVGLSPCDEVLHLCLPVGQVLFNVGDGYLVDAGVGGLRQLEGLLAECDRVCRFALPGEHARLRVDVGEGLLRLD